MEPATATPAKSASGTELALRFGSLMLHCMGGRGGDVLRVIDESGLSFVQMKTLVALQDEEAEGHTVTALSDELGVSAASASRAVDGLVRKRLATRVEDSADRRVRRLTLTPRGSDLADRIISSRLAGLEDFIDSLEPDERKKLKTALDALLQRDDIAETYRSYERRMRR